MPVYPVEWVTLARTGYYPHMAKLDAAIWERFLDQFGANFVSVAYDVALGGYLPGDDEGTPDQRLGWQYSTALKIDAVIAREDEIWIVEVKPGGGTAGVGAALCYTLLAERDGFAHLPVVPVLVTDRTNPDVLFCAEQLGVLVVAVDEPINPEQEDDTEDELDQALAELDDLEAGGESG